MKERKLQLKDLSQKISKTIKHLKVLEKKYNNFMWLRGATAGIIVSLTSAFLYNYFFQEGFLKIFSSYSFRHTSPA